MRKIKKGDNVVVIAGQDKGKRGTVLRVVDAEHVLVEGREQVKKHQRPNPMKGEHGRHRRQGDAAPRLECCDLQPGHAEGRPRRHQACWRTAASVRFFKSNGEMIDA